MDTKVSELEELIELAEKVSENILSINKRIGNIIALLILSIFLIFIFIYLVSISLGDYSTISLIPKFNNTILIFLVLLTIVNYYGIKGLFEGDQLVREAKSERIILDNLLNMIHNYKELAYRDISSVKKAVLEMRLSRIKFYSRVKLKKASKSNRKEFESSQIMEQTKN